MKKYKRFLLLFIVLLLILIAFKLNNKKSSRLTIHPVSINYIENQIIGAELPRLLFANENKVIFENGANIFHYDLIQQKMTLSLDIIDFTEEYFSDEQLKYIRPWAFITKSGNEIILTFEPSRKYYTYNISNKVIKEISRKDYEAKRPNVYIYDNELYSKSTGRICRINDKRFVYLTHDNYKVNSIKIILVDDDIKIVYNAFNTN